jgi:hypothetical protein
MCQVKIGLFGKKNYYSIFFLLSFCSKKLPKVRFEINLKMMPFQKIKNKNSKKF